MQIRAMEVADVPRVVAAWNSVLVHDQLSEERFRGVMLEDANYERDGVMMAEENGEVLGLSACVVRRGAQGKDGRGYGWESRRGHLKGFFVVEGSQGEVAAGALLEAAEAYCVSAGKRELTLTVYTGRYLFPGLDVRYERLRGLLREHGYRDIETIEDVGVDLRDLGHEARLAAVRGKADPETELLSWEPSLLPAFRKFVAEGKMAEWFPVGWEARYAEPSDHAFILRRGDEIVGWARYWPSQPVAGFGPILVLERERGRGYGLRLLLECMVRARDAGAERMHAGWANTGFYIAAGWQIERRYAVLKKDLTAGGRS